MRARLAIASSGQTVELREILLRDKPNDMLEASPKGTVPVLIAGDVIDESRDVMAWALAQSDPEGLLDVMDETARHLVDECDGPFKAALDRTKYAVRYPDIDPSESRAEAGAFIAKLDQILDGKPYLFGTKPNMADLAILPFVRQFAHTDLNWWDAQPWPDVHDWLSNFKASERFAAIMGKYAPWKAGDDVILFP